MMIKIKPRISKGYVVVDKMCLPVSRLFWVSSLAYPNLLGTKGYVVVVVVFQKVSETTQVMERECLFQTTRNACTAEHAHNTICLLMFLG
jgi:hypothetical protein